MVGKSKSRATKSRAQELQFMLGYLVEPSLLLQALTLQPDGGSITLEGICFEWGKIGKFLQDITLDDYQKHVGEVLALNPQYVCHRTQLTSDQKKEIPRRFGIPKKVFSSQNKADLILVDRDNVVKYISYKDINASTAKLSQTSSKKQTYGTAQLLGGLTGVNFDHFVIPKEFDHNSTFLDEEQFKRLKSTADKKRAYVKKKYPDEWLELVEKRMDEAYNCLEAFGQSLELNQENFVQFVKKIFVGDAANVDQNYLVLGNRAINIASLLEKLESENYSIQVELYPTENKFSLIVWVILNGQRYGLTKIEPSFEGAKPEVSQTKGVIYHFQQHPEPQVLSSVVNEDKNYKDLLRDICK